MTRSLHFRLFLVLALMVIVFSGCSRDPNVRKQKYFQSGQRYFQKGKYREAAIEFVNAIKIDPNYGEAHYQLAETSLKLQQAQRAYQELTRTIELQPENYQARIELANLLLVTFYQSQRRFNEAEQQFHRAMGMDPKSPEPRAALARLYVTQGKKADAEEILKQARHDFPDDSAGYRMLGDFYFMAGDL